MWLTPPQGVLRFNGRELLFGEAKIQFNANTNGYVGSVRKVTS